MVYDDDDDDDDDTIEVLISYPNTNPQRVYTFISIQTQRINGSQNNTLTYC